MKDAEGNDVPMDYDVRLKYIEDELDRLMAQDDITKRNKGGVFLHQRLEDVQFDMAKNGHTDEQRQRFVAANRRLLTEIFNIPVEEPS